MRQKNYESPLQYKISQFERVQKEIERLKHHLKMKRRVYDAQEYHSINDRIKQCEGLFKKEKYQVMREAADKIIVQSNVSDNLYDEVKSKLELSRKIRVKPKAVADDKDSSRFNINVKTEQSSVSNEKVITEYELIPSRAGTIKSHTLGGSRSRVKTEAEERRDNDRYVSQFQRKIKEQLSQLPIQTYHRRNNQIQPGHISPQRKNTSEVKAIRSPRLKLPPLQLDQSKTIIKKYKFRPKNNYSAFDNPYQVDRYQMMKERVDSSKSNLKERHTRQIDKISNQNLDKIEKSRVLKGMSSRFEDKSKFGDDNALDLMSRATIARANVLLGQRDGA